MMIIVFLESLYLSRVYSYSKFRIFKPFILYILFAIISKTANPIHFDTVIRLPFLFYLCLFVVSSILRTRVFIKKITFDFNKKEFEVIILKFYTEYTYQVKVDKIKMELNNYDMITRSVNHYLKLTLGDHYVFKQYDYFPWTKEFMLKVSQEIEAIKKKQSTER